MIDNINRQKAVRFVLLVSFFSMPLSSALYAEDSYLESLDKASGHNPVSSLATVNGKAQENLLNSSGRDEVESVLAQSFPEEYSTYRKLSNSDKNEIIKLYESTEGSPEFARTMKVINKIGLLSSSEW